MHRAITAHRRTGGPSASCFVCGKGPTAGFNRPKSLHKTKRVVYPNLVTFGDGKICTRCLRSLRPRQAAV